MSTPFFSSLKRRLGKPPPPPPAPPPPWLMGGELGMKSVVAFLRWARAPPPPSSARGQSSMGAATRLARGLGALAFSDP